MSEIALFRHHTIKGANRFPGGLLGLFIGLLFMLPLLPGSARGQAVNEAWTSLYSGSNFFQPAWPVVMTLDASGNVYIAGTSQSPSGYYHLATIKYDSQGNQVWAALSQTNATYLYVGNLQLDNDGKISVTGNSELGAWSIKYDENGNQLSEILSTNLIWLAQRFSVQPSGAFSLVGIKAYGILLVENYDATGNLLSTHERPLSFSPEKLTIDASNNIVVGATGYDTNSLSSIAMAKYDSTGSLVWETNYKGLEDGEAFFGNFTMDTNGNTFVTGYSVDTNYFGGEIILMKYDPQGNQIWVSDLGGGAGFVPNGIEVDAFGNLFVTQPDFTVVKCNGQGTRLWQSRPAPVTGSTYWYSILTLDRPGNLYLSGGLVKNGTQPNTPSISDRVTLKFDTEGHELWSQRYGLSTIRTIVPQC